MTTRTYLPGQEVVPCAVCQTPIVRRGSRGVGHKKWCSHECKLAGGRVPAEERNHFFDGICSRCGVNPKALRPDGKRRSWCRECEAAQKAEYYALKREQPKRHALAGPDGGEM